MTITKLNIVKIIPMYAKILHSELISFCVTSLTSLTWFKPKLLLVLKVSYVYVINTLSELWLVVKLLLK